VDYSTQIVDGIKKNDNPDTPDWLIKLATYSSISKSR
jgi:hypothetical protein